MTTTDPTTRPIHERWDVGDLDPYVETFPVRLDGELTLNLFPEEAAPFRDLLTAAGKTHAVLVNLPDGSQVLTCSYPNGAVEASVRSSSDTRERWTPVDMLGGSVEVAP